MTSSLLFTSIELLKYIMIGEDIDGLDISMDELGRNIN